MLTRSGPGGLPVVSVLGGSGFLGGSIVRALAERPVHIRSYSRRPTTVDPLPAAITGSLTAIPADLTDEHAVAEAVRGADAVIVAVGHTGGERSWRVAADDQLGYEVNVGVARSVARWCAASSGSGPGPVVVFAGSTSQAGHHPQPLTGGEPDHPVSPYDKQKLAAERSLLGATRAGDCRAISLRLPTVFGPAASPAGQDNGVVSSVARRALAGRPLTLWHDGGVHRNLLYVPDAAAAFVAALAAPDRLAGSAWIVASDQHPPLCELFSAIADEVADLTGAPRCEILQVPPPAYASLLDLRSVQLDPSRFRAATAWSAQTGWREAVRCTVAFLLAEHQHRCDLPEGAR